MKDELNQLLDDLKTAYDVSDIKHYCEEHNKGWFYSLVTTTMEKGGPMVIGFNWGAAKEVTYDPQLEVVKSDFLEEEVGSLSRIFPFCKQYFGDDFLSRITQTNYCFFRSHEEKQITPKDVELCEPILKRLIEIVQPSSILCFSSQLRNRLLKDNKLNSVSSTPIKFKRGKQDIIYDVYKARVDGEIDIYFLPHPNYPMKAEARAAAWASCFV